MKNMQAAEICTRQTANTAKCSLTLVVCGCILRVPLPCRHAAAQEAKLFPDFAVVQFSQQLEPGSGMLPGFYPVQTKQGGWYPFLLPPGRSVFRSNCNQNKINSKKQQDSFCFIGMKNFSGTANILLSSFPRCSIAFKTRYRADSLRDLLKIAFRVIDFYRSSCYSESI
ncbi:MAG: hypothetical protein ACLSWS_15585 [Faecalispora jeddahensis]